MKTVLWNMPPPPARLSRCAYLAQQKTAGSPREFWRSIAKNGYVDAIRRQGQKTFFANTMREDQIGVRRERNI